MGTCLGKWEQTTLKSLRKACRDLPKNVPTLPRRPSERTTAATSSEVQAILNMVESLKQAEHDAEFKLATAQVEGVMPKAYISKGVLEKELQRFLHDTLEKLIQRSADAKDGQILHERVKDSLSLQDDLAACVTEQKAAMWKELRAAVFDKLQSRANSTCEKQLPLAVKQSS